MGSKLQLLRELVSCNPGNAKLIRELQQDTRKVLGLEEDLHSTNLKARQANTTLQSTLLGAMAIALAVLLDIAPAAAQTRDSDIRASRATQKSVTKTPKTSAKEEQTSTPILDRCKRSARGLRGPERARFMTNCLKKKKGD